MVGDVTVGMKKMGLKTGEKIFDRKLVRFEVLRRMKMKIKVSRMYCYVKW
jgi:hypothetical protein